MTNSNNTKDTQLFVGIDVGSTTTKILKSMKFYYPIINVTMPHRLRAFRMP